MSPQEVKVYSTSTWPYCTLARSFLESTKVQFKEFNVGEDKAARDEMIKKSGRMVVPVIDIDGEVFVGFDQGALKKKLGIS